MCQTMSEWKIHNLREFLKKCPAKTLIYGYPQRNIFLKYMTEDEKKSFLKRENYSSDADGIMMMTEEEWKAFYGEDGTNSKEILASNLRKVKFNVKNGVIYPEDLQTEYIRFFRGHRYTEGVPQKVKRKIYLFGACNVMGLWCRDEHTIASFLQKFLNVSKMEVEVVNCGVWGSENIYCAWNQEKITSEDIVIVIMTAFGGSDLQKIAGCSYYGDLEQIIVETRAVEKCLFNNIAHHNYRLNEKISQEIYHDIIGYLKEQQEINEIRVIHPTGYFISWNIYEYFNRYLKMHQLPLRLENKTVGGIVMNCNPFTIGHRYLLDQALKQVDYLYVFVVEEDKSQFPFCDRFEMVKRGTEDLKNVYVVPSGKYILSIFTFPDYFEKTQIKEVFNPEYDLYIFADIVAPALKISKRFVGTEPLDWITRTYNEAMKKILPQKGVEVIEVERLKDEAGVISASRVRKALQDVKTNEALKLIPLSNRVFFENM